MSFPFSQVYYFGDSLTDTNVVASALVEAVDTIPFLSDAQVAFISNALLDELGFGPERAVSNDVTHAVYASEQAGFDLFNFANAGARALGTQNPFAFSEPIDLGGGIVIDPADFNFSYDSNLGGQLARFSALTGPGGQGVAANSAAVLYIGSNDFSDAVADFAELPTFLALAAVADFLDQLVDALRDAAQVLNDSGVGTIFFGTLPSATFFPGTDALGGDDASLADLAIGIYNGLLSSAAEDLNDAGVTVEMIDYQALSNAITEDPTSIGIVADRSEFLSPVEDNISDLDVDQVGFWDPIHPAEAIHQAWGAYSNFVMEGGTTASLTDFGTINIQGKGNNAVFANGGNDTLFLRGGDDIALGGTGNDNIFSGSGSDISIGGAGDDNIRGQSGNDILSGDGGNDILRGGSGNDVLIDGLGNDTSSGGSGDDVFIYVQSSLDGGGDATFTDVFRGGSGTDSLYLVVDEATFDSFEANAAGALAALNISAQNIEAVELIDGRGAVSSVLGSETWFEDADLWGLIPAPTTSDTPLV